MTSKGTTLASILFQVKPEGTLPSDIMRSSTGGEHQHQKDLTSNPIFYKYGLVSCKSSNGSTFEHFGNLLVGIPDLLLPGPLSSDGKSRPAKSPKASLSPDTEKVPKDDPPTDSLVNTGN